ncbi:MAG: nuclear transport factor 2 family protein [Roseivirga sp.]|nr:nuclear transport factor 2 family protein [Roseivirga sp.]
MNQLSRNSLIISLSLLFLSANGMAQEPSEKEAIKQAIIQTYAHPLYGGGSLEDIRAGLHEGFEMFVLYQGEFRKSSKAEWIKRLEEVRSRPKKSNRPKVKRSYEFAMIDVTGQTAMVKLEVFQDDTLKFTDYLTLYKFEDGWKLMSKLFSFH